MATQTIIGEMRDAIRERDLLQHSFYKRWLAGDLAMSELADYAAQYYHVVKLLPKLLEIAAEQDREHRNALLAHAVEERAHVRLWERFAEACGVPAQTLRSLEPNRATRAMIDACMESAGAGNAATVVWALEVQTPAVSKEKIHGLEQHYGIGVHSGGEYFALHEHLDVEHAAELENVIASRPREGAPAAALTAADGVWNLLTSVERAA